MRELTSTCNAYLAKSERAPTMSDSEIAEKLEAAGIAAASFTRLFDLNAALGRRRIAVRQRTADNRLRTVFHQIGVPQGEEPTIDPKPSFEFFSFGVAAPCTVQVTRSAAVVADFGGPTVDVADSFEVFIEGVARRVLAEKSGWTLRAVNIERNMDEVLLELPPDDIVAEASDRWTTWWHGSNFLAEFFTMWDISGQRSLQLNVWANGSVPAAFVRHLTPR
jgi:hypothetical protein